MGHHLGKLLKTILGILVIVLAVVGILAIVKGTKAEKKPEITQKTTKLGFEDIGEMATQVAYCTEVSTIDASREMLGISIPFTQSKYVYSYDVEIKAGMDFSAVHWMKDDEKKTIEITMPEIKVLSCEINTESFKVYYEKESVFRPITLEENNESMGELQENAVKDAEANGLLDNARNNAEKILNNFFKNGKSLKEYQIEFIESEETDNE